VEYRIEPLKLEDNYMLDGDATYQINFYLYPRKASIADFAVLLLMLNSGTVNPQVI